MRSRARNPCIREYVRVKWHIGFATHAWKKTGAEAVPTESELLQVSNLVNGAVAELQKDSRILPNKLDSLNQFVSEIWAKRGIPETTT